jgi:hypothetical protein
MRWMEDKKARCLAISLAAVLAVLESHNVFLVRISRIPGRREESVYTG